MGTTAPAILDVSFDWHQRLNWHWFQFFIS
jgi:hypothetical protein